MSQDLSSCNVAMTFNYSVEKCGCVAVSEELDLYITRWSDRELGNCSFHSSTGLFMNPEGGGGHLEHREHDRAGWESMMRRRAN